MTPHAVRLNIWGVQHGLFPALNTIRMSVFGGEGAALSVMADRASNFSDVVHLKIVSRMRSERKRLLVHARIFQAYVARYAAVDTLQFRQDKLPNFYVILLRFPRVRFVLGHIRQGFPVCPLVMVVFTEQKSIDRCIHQQRDTYQT